MTALALVLLALADAPAVITAIRIEAESDRPVVRVAVSGHVEARVTRVASELVLMFPGAHLLPALAVPGPLAEIRSITAEETLEGARLRIRVEGPADHELTQEGGVVSLVLRGRRAPAASPPPPGGRSAPEDVRDLYAKIVPPAAEPVDAAAAPISPDVLAEGADQALHLGTARVRPSVGLVYVDADVAFLDTPAPVRDRYFQVEPHLPVDFGSKAAGRANLHLSYDPRFRVRTAFAELRQPSHLLTASAEVPVAPGLTVRGSHHFAHGLLETTEVDPGREYFFRLAPFTRNQSLLGLSYDPGGLFALELAGTRDAIRIDDQAAFFDHRVDTLSGSLDYDFSSRAHAYARYAWSHIPRPVARPEAESTSSTVSLGAAGDLLPLVSGEVSVGLRSLEAPRGGPGGTHFTGVVLAGSVRKEFTPAATATLLARRDTYPSAFEENAFYVVTGVGAETDLRMVLSLVFHGGLGWQRNAYRVRVAELGRARQDDLLGWSAGLGRVLTSWSFLRADYRHDRRHSNLAVYNSSGHVFTIQVGLGFLGPTTAAGAGR